MRLLAELLFLMVMGEATVPRRMYELSPIPCSSQTGCMEHAHCVAGRCRCQSPYTYYASQCVAGKPGLSGPLPDSPSNPMIVPASIPANSFTQPLQSIYDVPRPPPPSPPRPAYQPILPAPSVPIYTQNEAPPPPPPQPSHPPLRVSMGGQTYIMESLVQYPPVPPPPALVPLQPAMLPLPPPCNPAPAFPCYYPPPVVLPPVTPPSPTTTTTRPLRDETITPTEEPTTRPTTTTTTTTTAATTTTTTTEEPTTTEEITTTTEEPSTTTEEVTTTEEINTLPPITTSVDSILVTTTTTTQPPITTAVLPTVITTTSTTTMRPLRDEPIISFPLEPCVIPGTLCVGGSRCMQGMCLCRMNEEVIDGECSAIPQPPCLSTPCPPPQPTVYQLNPQRCQSQSCCQPGFVFQNQQCNPPPPQKIRAINIVVGTPCSNTVQCDRGAYCLSGLCQCANGYHQLNNRCISLRQLL